MKHFYFLIFLLGAVAAMAQRPSGATTAAAPGGGVKPPVYPYNCSEAISGQQRQADSLLLPLDKSQIPTHILYDRVPALAALDVFNRVYNDPDTSSIRHFMQAYYELQMADYNNLGTKPCRQLLADNAAHYQQRDTILLGALRYRFNYIDSNAVRNNQLRWDTSAPSRLFDVAGRSGSPYLLCEVAVAAALADSTRSGAVSFRLDPASIFTNTGAVLSSASIDFGDGSPARACTPGQVVQVSYGTTGLKVLRYVLTYTDGSQFITYSRLYVPQAVCSTCRTTATVVPPCRTEPGFTSAISHQGIYGKAEVSYFYSTNPNDNPPKFCEASSNLAQPITKPIIIVDGIDYEGIRKGGEIFGEYLKYKRPNSEKVAKLIREEQP